MNTGADSIDREGAALPRKVPRRIRLAPSWIPAIRLSTEWVIVIMMVAAAVLSAVTFWQATEFAERASDLTDQARLAEAHEAQRRSAVRAQVAHDRQVLLGCQTAVQRRDGALAEYSRSFADSAIASFVEAEHARITLEALLVADSGCGDYQVRRALDFAAVSDADPLSQGDPDQLRSAARVIGHAENLAVLAAVIFAVVLLILTLADSTPHRRWIRRWVAASLALVAVGIEIAAAAFLQAGVIPIDATLMLLALLLTLGIIAWVLGHSGSLAWLRAIGARWQNIALHIQLRWGTMGLWRPIRSWAEILGAATLVLFALAVLGFSTSTIQEREGLARADRLTSQARQALELGQQSSLAVLSFVSQLSELDARLAAASRAPGQEVPLGTAPDEHARTAVLDQMWPAEQAAWKTLFQEHESQVRANSADSKDEGRASTCLREDLVLAWKHPPPTGTSGEARLALPERILQGFRDEPRVLENLIDAGAAGAIYCSTQAAVVWQEARGWGQRASLFTVALVVLGLAGFLFALAADAEDERSRLPRNWLFSSGTVGLVVALGAAGMATISTPIVVSQGALEAGATAYTRSQIASAALDCPAADRESALALVHLDHFAQAHLVRADSLACAEDATWLLSGDLPVGNGDTYIEELERTGPDIESSAMNGSLGWAYALSALRLIDDPQAHGAALEHAADRSALALEDDPSNPFWCFNRAFLGVLGDPASALDLYAEALTSLAGSDAGPCQKVPFGDDSLRDLIRLWALADLELLEGHPGIDEYRQAIVGGDQAHDDACSYPDPDGQELDIFPQEIGLPALDGKDKLAPDFSAVWYYRPLETSRWSVMILPSLVTLDPGCHANLWAVGHLLPPGDYRVDVYEGGSLAHRLVTANDWWESRGLDHAEFRRVQVPDLGLSAVIPRDWQVISAQAGVGIEFGSQTGSLAWRRTEGIDGDVANQRRRLIAWSTDWLRDRGVDPVAEEVIPTEENAEWYLGMDRALAIEAREGLWLGTGHNQYLVAAPTDPVLAAEADPLLTQEDVTDPSCPGTSLMTVVESADPDLTQTVWLSQVNQGQLHTVPATDISLTGSFIGPRFSLDFPEGWQAAGCPNSFVALESEGRAYLLVGSQEWQGTLDAFVADQVTFYDEEYPDFELEEDRAIALSDGSAAREVSFSSTASLPLWDAHVFAKVGNRVYFLLFTTTSEDRAELAPEVQALVSSFRVVALRE